LRKTVEYKCCRGQEKGGKGKRGVAEEETEKEESGVCI